MKVLLTSAKALCHPASSQTNDELLDILVRLHHEKVLAAVVIISSQGRMLEKFPKTSPYHTVHLPHRKTRRQAGFIDQFVGKDSVFSTARDIVVLGATASDALMSFNNKLIMFSALWFPQSSDTKMIHDYGIGLESPDHLYEMFSRFLVMKENYYYSIQDVDERTSLFSLLSANNRASWIPDEQKQASQALSSILKDGTAQANEVAIYFLLAMYNKLEVLREVDFWTVYPSSTAGDHNPVLQRLRDELRKVYKFGDKPEVLIRRHDAPKRHYMRRAERLKKGCSQQFDTIIVNPELRGKLHNKTVCVLDDYTTYGSSCETSRHLLAEVGVRRVIFITIGKFGSEYHAFDYDINGDVYGDYSYHLNGSVPKDGTIDRTVLNEAVEVLGDVL